MRSIAAGVIADENALRRNALRKKTLSRNNTKRNWANATGIIIITRRGSGNSADLSDLNLNNNLSHNYI